MSISNQCSGWLLAEGWFRWLTRRIEHENAQTIHKKLWTLYQERRILKKWLRKKRLEFNKCFNTFTIAQVGNRWHEERPRFSKWVKKVTNLCIFLNKLCIECMKGEKIMQTVQVEVIQHRRNTQNTNVDK